MKKALITGITGQSGSYLAEHLLNLGYCVHGTLRRSSSFNTGRIDHIFKDLELHYADLTDAASLNTVMDNDFDEVYNLGAQSHVKTSFDVPSYTAQATALGTLNLLEACRFKDVRFYQAGSSEMFGNEPAPQSELTPFRPRSPYGCSKVFAHNICVNYRESYGMHISNGILFNHESPRRGETFVTRKITKAIGRILAGKQNTVVLGNLDAKRDWGYAKEYVEAMHLMLQQGRPGDYVIATGETHTVREFLEEAFSYVGLDWKNHVTTNSLYYRPAEVDMLQGDASKAERILGWKPKTTFKELVRLMVDADRI
jgi:GDPmannose 4,6-dehydratase